MLKPIKTILVALLLLVFFVPNSINAQTDDESEKMMKPTTVVSHHMVSLSKVGRFTELTNKYWVPSFDKLVDDGKLFSWGFMTHAWGDEWNLVFHYTAKDFATFEKAWQEGYANFAKNVPEDEEGELSEMIQAHKDGIYTDQHFYNGKPMK